MAKSYQGQGEPRKPITVTELSNGKYEVLDGNATTQAAKLAGWDSVPVKVLGAHEADLFRQADALREESRPTLFNLLGQLHDAFPDHASGDIFGRVKSVESTVEKNLKGEREEPENDNTPAGLKDMVATTVMMPDVASVRAAGKTIQDKFDVATKPDGSQMMKDYLENDNDGYRAMHFNVVTGPGRVAEIQIKTPNQAKLGEFMHERIYKPHGTPAQNAAVAENRPAIMAYVKAVSAHYYAMDSKRGGTKMPNCIEVIARTVGCL